MAEKEDKPINELFTEILIRIKQDVEISLLMDSLGRYKRKYRELAKIGVTPDYEVTLKGEIKDVEETLLGFLYAVYETAKEKSGVERARAEMSEVLEHLIATSENTSVAKVAKEFLSKIRLERSPVEEIAEKLLKYKFEGYPIEDVIGEKEKGKDAFLKAYEEYVAKIEKLKSIEAQLDELDVTGFEKEALEIRSHIKNPAKLDYVEQLMNKIVAGASIDRMEKELNEISKEIDVLEKKVAKKPKIQPAPKTPREGKVNGRKDGRINGRINGKVNGMRESKGVVPKRETEAGKRTAIALIVFLLLAIPPAAILLYTEAGIKIDGNLDDWAGKASIEQVPTGMDVPITKYAIDVDEKYVYFYLQVQSPRAVFESSGNQRDTVLLFLDTGQAGYRFDGINAKYKVEISGSEGNVVSTSLSEYQGDGTSWKWAPKGSIEAKASIGTLEGRIKKSDIGNAEPTVYILAQHADGKTGKSIIPFNKEMKGVALTQVGIVDEIVQPDANATLLTVNARAYGKDVELKTLLLKRSGGYNGVLNVRVVDANNAELGTASFSDGAIETTATLNRAVGTTGDLTFKVVADVSGIANNSIGLKVAGATVEGTVKVYGESKVVYVGAPTGIIIDGAFGDWAGIQGHDDPAGDVAMIPTTLPANSNIDINATKYTNDTNNVYFYAKVYGDKIMAGLTQVYRGVAGGGQSGTPTPIEEVDIYDYLYINFTVSAVGKEYSIQVVGKDGVVLSKKVLEKDIQAMVWSESTGLSASLTVACAAGELELGIPFADGQITTYTVTMSDWIGKDTTSVIFSYHGGIRASGEIQPKGTPHAPIHINGNADFAAKATAESWPGDGTQNNPYIIDGYEINANGGSYGIWIENTDVYFVIRNCNITNASNSGSAPYGSGIALNNVQNGTIENNTCTNSKRGIYLSNSGNNTLTNNNVLSNEYGIYLSAQSTNNYNHNLLYSNNVLTNEHGIYIYRSSNNTIINNNISENTVNGTYLYQSSNNTLSNNNISKNNVGIFLNSTSKNNLITYNWITQNSNYSINISSSSATGNLIHHNNFIANNGAGKGLTGRCQAYDAGGNQWYIATKDGKGTEGNYWSNWDGKDDYPIDGSSASDPSPFSSPVSEFTQLPLFAMFLIGALVAIARKRKH
ncbi:MAG: NosD domain-containing protein [Thermoplasmata archaeon]